MDDKIMDFAKKLDEKEYLNNISVPILDGFQMIENPGTLFTAISEDNSIEQFLCDGVIRENETFESHIELVVKDIKDTMNESGLEDSEHNVKFFKYHKTKEFEFKIYIQDNVIDGKIIRQFNIFFMDSKSNAFYQLALSTAPYSTKDIKYVKNDLTLNVLDSITNLMNNIHYNN